jgi:hypothetical protein
MGAGADLIAFALFGKSRRNLLALLFIEAERAFHVAAPPVLRAASRRSCRRRSERLSWRETRS